MDLVKLVVELREYRAQIDEAIGAMEQLARRRHPEAPTERISPQKSETVPLGDRKKKRKASKGKSR
jgi:hypothetical protein